MRHWVNDGLFARGLAPGEKDPMVGAQASGDTFTWRNGDGAGAPVSGLSRFVKTRGALYLFYPSVTALRYISALPEQHQSDRQKEAIDEAIEVVVEAMTRVIGNGTTRDAHPKHHGLVTARFTVADNVPDPLKHGLFSTAQSFRAYVRFSNGRPGPLFPPDAAPDVRGMPSTERCSKWSTRASARTTASCTTSSVLAPARA